MSRGSFLVVVTLAFLLPSPSMARETAPLTGYALTSWTERDGVPIGMVRAIVQDADGYLWLGTQSGLLRFDGVRLMPAQVIGFADLPSTLVRSLLLTRDGALWVGLGEDAGLWVLRNGQAERPGSPLSQATIGGLAEDRSGAIWAATSIGVFRHAGGMWTEELVGGLRGQPAAAVLVDRDGRVWVGTASGLFVRNDAGRFDPVGPSSRVRGIAQDASGRIWVTDPRVGFREGSRAVTSDLAHEGSGLGIFADRRANIWVGTAGQGLWRLRSNEPAPGARIEVATVDNGLVSNGIWVAFEDREGNLWLGSQLGLTRLTPHMVTPIADLGVVNAVESDETGIWAGTAGGLLHVTAGRSWSTPAITRLLAHQVVALHRDSRGRLWVAAEAGLQYVAGGRLQPPPFALRLAAVRSITHTPSGDVWFADRDEGLVRWDGTELQRVALPATLARPIRFIHADRSGRIWVAFSGGRLGYVDSTSGQFVEAGAERGFAAGAQPEINAIADDRDGAVWIGGNGGLTRYADSRFVTVGRDGGLPGRRVTAIAVDADQHLWLAIDGGVVRLKPAEFLKAASTPGHRIPHTRIDTSHGFGGVPVGSANEGVAAAPDGGLWFSTGWGLTRVDPQAAQLHRSPRPLPLRVEAAIVDEVRFAPEADRTLPARSHAVRIDYTALSLTAPARVRFRYRLEGFDDNWVDAGTRRQAYYTNLPPGRYRFLVEAEASDQAWLPATTSWAFAVAPRFYQTATFYATTAAGLLLIGWSAWRLRLRQMRRQFAAVLAERARLSREIHDTLLQNLAGVAIQCAGVSNALEPDSPARQQLVTIRKQVEGSVRDLRQAVWELRAPALETGDLVSALREFGLRATSGTGVRFELTVAGRPRRFPARLENDVLRIGEEAVRNAVRHAQATVVRVELQFRRVSLRLNVSDNGRGLAQPSAADHHFGLIGMRERAAEIGGRLRIGRPASGGTDVELIVPAAAQPQRA